MRSLGVAALALVAPVGLCGQSPSDTASVYLTAWDQVIGSAPLAHPQGATSRVCFELGAEQTVFEGVSDEVTGRVVRALDERLFEVVEGCTMGRQGDGGVIRSWVAAESLLPAVFVRLWELRFVDPLRARVGLHQLAGRRWGVAEACTVTRGNTDAAWEVEHCRTVAQN